jgi:pimeloyl-ACP methyl ester carboxylesterase
MKQRGLNVVLPLLKDSPDSKKPFWKQHVDSVSRTLEDTPKDRSVILVAHSGAGPLLPAIAKSLAHSIAAYVFVDAGIPRDGTTRLDMMKWEDSEWAKDFQEKLERGEHYPNWSGNDLREIIPNEGLRNQLATEIRPRGLDFFSEPIPIFNGWPDAPCIYIQFSAPYSQPAIYARKAGWPIYKLDAGHFHMLVDAPAVTDIVVDALNALI